VKGCRSGHVGVETRSKSRRGKSWARRAGGTNRVGPSVVSKRSTPTFSLKTGSVRIVVPSRLMRNVEWPIQASVIPPSDQDRGSGGVCRDESAASCASTSPLVPVSRDVFHRSSATASSARIRYLGDCAHADQADTRRLPHRRQEQQPSPRPVEPARRELAFIHGSQTTHVLRKCS